MARTRLRLFATALAVAMLWLTPSAQQQLRYPLLVSDTNAPGIDRGLRDNDAPRPPRTSRTVRVEPYLRGSVIVKFREGTGDTARTAMMQRVNAAPTRRLSDADFDVVTIDSASDPEAVARQLATQPDVEYAQARYRARPMFVPNDPLYPRQWNFPAIEMERAWDLNPGAASDVIVAVLDSGVAFRNVVLRYQALPFTTEGGVAFPGLGTIDVPFAVAPDLGPENRFVSPRDFIWDDSFPVDLDGHGTHVTGTLGQSTNNGIGVAGIAFNVRIMPVKVISSEWDDIFNSPFVGTDDSVARGIRYAVDNGARVLNLSIGRSGPPAPVVESALVYAVSRGAFVAVAGGNDFEDGNPIERYAEAASHVDGAISVAAVGPDRRRAFYSSTGSWVEVAAPGGSSRVGGSAGAVLQQTYDPDFVFTFENGPARYGPPRFDVFAYVPFQGTSMATPHVAGLAALLMQHGVTGPAAIEAALKRFASDLGTPGRDIDFGYGLINARTTLRGMGLLR